MTKPILREFGESQVVDDLEQLVSLRNDVAHSIPQQAKLIDFVDTTDEHPVAQVLERTIHTYAAGSSERVAGVTSLSDYQEASVKARIAVDRIRQRLAADGLKPF